MSENVNPFGTPKQQPATTTATEPAKATKSAKSAKKAKAPEVASATPANQAPSPFGDTATPAAPKKSHKGLIIGLSAGLVAIIIAVVAVVLLINMNKVTADDYDSAMTKLSDTYQVLNDTDGSLTSSSASSMDESELSDIIDKSKKAMDDGQKQLDELGKLKAIAKDSDAKDKYDKLNSSYKDLKDKMNQYMDTIKQILPVYTAVQKVSDIDYSYDDSYYSQMSQAYQGVADAASKAKIEDKTAASAISDLRDAAQAYADYYKKQADKQEVSYSSVSSASRKYSSASSKLSSSLSPSDLLDASSKLSRAYSGLNSYLSDKYYKLRK